MSSGTSTLLPANNIITDGGTVGDTVTDSTVNVANDIIYSGGTSIENLAQNTAFNALDSFNVANNLSASTESLTAVWDSFNLDVLIPSKIWTLQYWEKYLASYGVCLGDFNIGMARAMQKDIGNTSTDCFL